MNGLYKIHVVLMGIGSKVSDVAGKATNEFNIGIDKIALLLLLFSCGLGMVNKKAGISMAVTVGIMYIIALIINGGGIDLLKSLT